MITAGCDVGSLTAKAVLMRDDRIMASAVIKSKARPQDSAEAVFTEVLKRLNIEKGKVTGCIGTGYGREKIDFADGVLSEIACHGKGARWLMPSARTVIDIGGQDAKVLKLNPDGSIANFKTNDKCAAGTGRFLEVMSKVLNIGLEELGRFSARADDPVTFASSCTVWAQADVIKYLNSGYPIENVAAGINTAMATRVAVMVSAVGIEKDIIMTGGVAKNIGVVRAMEKIISHRINVPRKADPQIAGAIGAALFAREKEVGS